MTPLEISEYKQRWMSSGYNHPVRIHSDLRTKAKDWCKVQLFQHQWKHMQFTNVYEDTFYFEHLLDSTSFAHYFTDWVIND